MEGEKSYVVGSKEITIYGDITTVELFTLYNPLFVFLVTFQIHNARHGQVMFTDFQ